MGSYILFILCLIVGYLLGRGKKMPCIMPEMPYCPACPYGHIVKSWDDPSSESWECLCTEENIKWFEEDADDH